MAYEHYCEDKEGLSLERMANMCADIGLLPDVLSFAQLRARFRACVAAAPRGTPSSMASLMAGGSDPGSPAPRGPATLGYLGYAGMLRCLRACAEAAFVGQDEAASDKLVRLLHDPPAHTERDDDVSSVSCSNFFRKAARKPPLPAGELLVTLARHGSRPCIAL